MNFNVEGNINALESDLKRVIDKLPSICVDTVALLFIMQTLIDAYKEASGNDLKL